MSIVAEFVVDLPDYAAVMEDVPGMRLAVEQMVACDPETVLITFWAEGDAFDSLESGLERAAEIIAVDELSDRIGGRKLYQVRLPAATTAYWEWVGRSGVLLDCSINHEGVWMRMRFPDRESLIDYRRAVRDRGCSFSLTELRSTDIRPEGNRSGLTHPQQELLAMAVEKGYFEIPREIMMADIAAHFGISDQAASERLRRALSTMVGDHAALEQNGHRATPSPTG